MYVILRGFVWNMKGLIQRSDVGLGCFGEILMKFYMYISQLLSWEMGKTEVASAFVELIANT